MTGPVRAWVLNDLMRYYEKVRRDSLDAWHLRSISPLQAARIERIAAAYIEYTGRPIEELGAWLDAPVLSLGYRGPMELVRESEAGFEQVQNLLQQSPLECAPK